MCFDHKVMRLIFFTRFRVTQVTLKICVFSSARSNRVRPARKSVSYDHRRQSC